MKVVLKPASTSGGWSFSPALAVTPAVGSGYGVWTIAADGMPAFSAPSPRPSTRWSQATTSAGPASRTSRAKAAARP